MALTSALTPRDLPWVFISFREPNANANWLKLKQQIPEAHRSHGVVGIDQAHRAAAALVPHSEYFFTLDGDSVVWEKWLNTPLAITLAPHTAWCWRSRNVINDLTYGNGGVKLWHRSLIEHMNSHSDGVDFCWQPSYVSLNQTAGETDPGASERQAFIAGAREGVKLMLDRGVFLSPQQLRKCWNSHNRSAWLIWCTRGAHDATHKWAPFGARYSATQLLMDNWSPMAINDWCFLSSEFDKVQQSMRCSVENNMQFQTTYESQAWRLQYEQLGEYLQQVLNVHLPNCYDFAFWQWLQQIQQCYIRELPRV